MARMSPDEFDPDEGHPFLEEVEELRQEHISEFRGELLQSYYRSKEDCAVLAFDVYGEAARHMSVGDWRAAVVLGSAAIEACLRDAILRPIVCGLVHNAELAAIVAHHALSHASFDRVQALVFDLLKVHGDVDLSTYAREGTTKALWREIAEVRSVRNKIMHGAEKADQDSASHAVQVASHVLHKLLPRVLHELGFTLAYDQKRVAFVRPLGGMWGQRLPTRRP